MSYVGKFISTLNTFVKKFFVKAKILTLAMHPEAKFYLMSYRRHVAHPTALTWSYPLCLTLVSSFLDYTSLALSMPLMCPLGSLQSSSVQDACLWAPPEMMPFSIEGLGLP